MTASPSREARARAPAALLKEGPHRRAAPNTARLPADSDVQGICGCALLDGRGKNCPSSINTESSSRVTIPEKGSRNASFTSGGRLAAIKTEWSSHTTNCLERAGQEIAGSTHHHSEHRRRTMAGQRRRAEVWRARIRNGEFHGSGHSLGVEPAGTDARSCATGNLSAATAPRFTTRAVTPPCATQAPQDRRANGRAMSLNCTAALLHRGQFWPSGLNRFSGGITTTSAPSASTCSTR